MGPDKATEAAIHDFAEWLKGQDPLRIEHLWALMYNGTRASHPPTILAASSGIEHALWDIKGKALGVPVWQLGGGAVCDRVRVYQNPGGRTPEEMAERAVALIERYGHTAPQAGPTPAGLGADALERRPAGRAGRMKAVRDAVGPDVDVGLDPHAKIFEPARALQMAQGCGRVRPLLLRGAHPPREYRRHGLVQAPVPHPGGHR